MELIWLGGFLVVVASTLGAFACKPRDGESEDACIAKVLAIAAGVVAAFVFGMCFARSQISITVDGGIITLGRWVFVIPLLLLISMVNGRKTS